MSSTSPPKTIVIDMNATLAGPAVERNYASCAVIPKTVAALRRMHADGWRVVIFSARGMRTYSGDLESITEHVLPVMQDWLDRHEIPYDELHVAKPWAGRRGFYVDDRAIRPAEFLALSPEQVAERLAGDAVCDR